eukprot:2052333-Pyramimonas_sp.AAC.1
MSLMRMFREGPDVSLKGSPTVSPTTHALPCGAHAGRKSVRSGLESRGEGPGVGSRVTVEGRRKGLAITQHAGAS